MKILFITTTGITMMFFKAFMRSFSVSYSAVIGEGTVVMPNAVINSQSMVGNIALLILVQLLNMIMF